MKELKRLYIEEDRSGSVTIQTEGAEDTWHLLNLVFMESTSGAVGLSKKQLKL
jgi:hypothetical protein